MFIFRNQGFMSCGQIFGHGKVLIDSGPRVLDSHRVYLFVEGDQELSHGDQALLRICSQTARRSGTVKNTTSEATIGRSTC